jgi:hypothetical protein|tara:strand:- start:185 stop:439 length:255 start_codon:yes stop_codon:yes gene_type:complete
MFTTTNAKKIHVPIELRAKMYSYGGNSPRARRFVSSVRQFVHHSGGASPDGNPASQLLEDDPINSVPAIPIFKSKQLEDICSES